VAIRNLIDLFNNEHAVLGGPFRRLHPLMETSVMEGGTLTALGAPGRMAAIASGEFGADVPLLRAAELVLSDVVADPSDNEGRGVRGRAHARRG
jgi:hypothetical protein